MYRLIAAFAIQLVIIGAAMAIPPVQTNAARVLVAAALEAQGGAERLRAVKAVRLHAAGVSYALEQSVRPEGPWFQSHRDIIETRRFDEPALRQETKSRGMASEWWVNSRWAEGTQLVTGGAAFWVAGTKLRPGPQSSADIAEESLALGPERLLLTAAAAPDLRSEPKTMFRGQMHDVVGFRWRGAPVRILIAPVSSMPAAVEIVRPLPLDLYWSPWGDINTRMEWDFWTVRENGIRYPHVWVKSSNGQVEQSMLVDQIEFNPQIESGLLDAESAQIEAGKALRRPVSTREFATDKVVEVAPGITLFQGAWNVVKVVEPGGVYLIEAPISNSYSAGAMAQARLAQLPIRGLVTTTDSWPHIGGLREYAAEGVPIIALDLNRAVINRLLAASYRQRPDRLANRPRAAKIRLIDRPTVVGEGGSAMRLMPLRTITGERQMAIYWPAHKLLYTSDIMTPSADTVWLPQYRDEVADLIRRERLDVETVFGMHYAPTPWARVLTLPAPQPRKRAGG